jgi:hypothetical protein
VIASFVRADSHITRASDFHVGVARRGSRSRRPRSSLPHEVEAAAGCAVTGSASSNSPSLATAPAALRAGRPEVSREGSTSACSSSAKPGLQHHVGRVAVRRPGRARRHLTGAPDSQEGTSCGITAAARLVGDAMGQVFREAGGGVTGAFAASPPSDLPARHPRSGAGSERRRLAATSKWRADQRQGSTAPGTAPTGGAAAVRRPLRPRLASCSSRPTGERGYRVTLRRRTSGSPTCLSFAARTGEARRGVERWLSEERARGGRFRRLGERPTLAIDRRRRRARRFRSGSSRRSLPDRSRSSRQNARVDKTGHVVMCSSAARSISPPGAARPRTSRSRGKVPTADLDAERRSARGFPADAPGARRLQQSAEPVRHARDRGAAGPQPWGGVARKSVPVVITHDAARTIVEGRVISPPACRSRTLASSSPRPTTRISSP